jgi:hypothetical protein
MSFKYSTGLRTGMLGSQGFKALMDNCVLKIYAGAEPATADAELGAATLLCTLTVGGDGSTGLTFAPPAAGVITKNTSESWTGTASGTGVGTFFRVVKSADTEAASTTDLRIQGSVGTLGADMNLSSASFTSGTPFTLNYFSSALPTA